MADFSWMEEPDFRTLVTERVSNTAARAGMEKYQTEIVDALMGYLASNRVERRRLELAKAASLQRTRADALNSVTVLVEVASQYAQRAGRRTVTAQDFAQAYRDRHCQVWPFC